MIIECIMAMLGSHAVASSDILSDMCMIRAQGSRRARCSLKPLSAAGIRKCLV